MPTIRSGLSERAIPLDFRPAISWASVQRGLEAGDVRGATGAVV
jgi:hypothetical protein